jgi:hypothetical protein
VRPKTFCGDGLSRIAGLARVWQRKKEGAVRIAFYICRPRSLFFRAFLFARSGTEIKKENVGNSSPTNTADLLFSPRANLPSSARFIQLSFIY